MQKLKQIWQEITSNKQDKTFNALMNRYKEPHRAYHNPNHLNQMFEELKTAPIIDKQATYLAVFYHDAIYNTKSSTNEEDSAALAEKDLKALLTSNKMAHICEMIMATKTHSIENLPGIIIPDTKYLIDADLSILGQPKEQFEAYDKNIRKEYSWVDEEAYRKGRTKVLQSFLDKPRIYNRRIFRYKYEESARHNIENAIKQLNM